MTDRKQPVNRQDHDPVQRLNEHHGADLLALGRTEAEAS
jgi:hypothetical protein